MYEQGYKKTGIFFKTMSVSQKEWSNKQEYLQLHLNHAKEAGYGVIADGVNAYYTTQSQKTRRAYENRLSIRLYNNTLEGKEKLPYLWEFYMDGSLLFNGLAATKEEALVMPKKILTEYLFEDCGMQVTDNFKEEKIPLEWSIRLSLKNNWGLYHWEVVKSHGGALPIKQWVAVYMGTSYEDVKKVAICKGIDCKVVTATGHGMVPLYATD